MTSYQRGRRLEWRARDALEAMGYVVIRSASSKGPCDLVALKPGGHTLLVQVKADAWPTPAERAVLAALGGPHRVIEVWRYDRGVLAPRIRAVDGRW